MFWYWFLGAIFVIVLTLLFGAFMAKKTESVLIGQVWGVFAHVILVATYFLLGSFLR